MTGSDDNKQVWRRQFAEMGVNQVRMRLRDYAGALKAEAQRWLAEEDHRSESEAAARRAEDVAATREANALAREANSAAREATIWARRSNRIAVISMIIAAAALIIATISAFGPLNRW